MEELDVVKISEENTKKYLAQKADKAWNELSARKESDKLSRISSLLISHWEFMEIFAQLSEGETLTVNARGELFKGKVKTEKLRQLPQKIISRKPINLDDAEITFRSFVKNSDPVSTIGSDGFSHEWISTIRSIKTAQEVPLVEIFMEVYEQTIKKSPEKCHYEIDQNSFGEKITRFWIDGIKTEIIVNEFFRLISYKDVDGKFVEVK